MKINWKKVGDVIEWVPLPLGAIGLVLAWRGQNTYLLILSLWLLSFPLIERRLKLMSEQMLLLTMVAHMHAISIKDKVEEMAKRDLATPPPPSQHE